MKTYPNLDTKNARFNILKLSEGTYLVVIACGKIDGEALLRIFRTVLELSSSLPQGKVLIDFEAAELRLQPSDVDLVFSTVWAGSESRRMEIAIVSSRRRDGADRLCHLKNSLRRAGVKAALFDNTRSAVAWLSGRL
jgi:hypothetical protein